MIVRLGPIRINLYLIVDVFQATLKNMLMFDAISYTQACVQSKFDADLARLTLDARIDVLECD